MHEYSTYRLAYLCFLSNVFTQTLVTLNLENNAIKDEGARSFARALRVNKVNCSLHTYYIHFYHHPSLQQKLASLNLLNNAITLSGAEQILNALEHNTVSFTLIHRVSSISRYMFIIRRSLRLTC